MRFLVIIFMLMTASCSNYSHAQAEKDLNLLLVDDLRVITEGLDSSLLLDKPYFTIREITWFEKSKYSCNSVVDFYFLKDKCFRIERKYRLVLDMQKWDRYHNEYKIIQN